MKSYKIIMLSLILVALQSVLFRIAYGQGANLLNEDGVPPPPAVASLGNYLNNDVTEFTGQPDISIPIYNIQTPNLNLPIRLIYSTDNLKIDNVAGPVGHGWMLDVGGMVSAQFYGPPDAYSFGGTSATRVIPDWQSLDTTTSVPQWVEKVVLGQKDVEPDIFFFSFPGGNGQFVLTDEGDPMLFEQSNDIISYEMGLNKYNRMDFIQWIVKDDRGITYTYGKLGGEHSSNWGDCLVRIEGINQWPSNIYYTNTWYLRKIESPYGDWIKIDYEPTHGDEQNGVSYNSSNTFRNEYGLGPHGYHRIDSIATTFPSPIMYIDKKIKKITTSTNEVIDFKSDIWGQDNPELIFLFSEIETNNQLISFAYSMLNDALSGKRPKLDELVISGKDGASQHYQFLYNDNTPLPPRYSYAQDLWGYYNGETNNNSYIPQMRISNMPLQTDKTDLTYDITELIKYDYSYDVCGTPKEWSFPGANRDVSPSHITTGALKTIIFPTGGKKHFSFEPHDFSYVQNKEVEIKQYHEEERVSLATPSGLPYISDSFTVTASCEALIQTTFKTLVASNQFPNGEGLPYVQLRDGTDSIIYSQTMPAPTNNGIFEFTTTHQMELNPDTYTLELYAEDNPDYPDENALCESRLITLTELTPLRKVFGGGLRIKEIRFEPIVGEDIVINYDYSDGEEKSHGVLFNYPLHARVWQPNTYFLTGSINGYSFTNCGFRVLTFGKDISNVNSVQAPTISYKQVVTLQAGSGKTVKKYKHAEIGYIFDIIEAPPLPTGNEPIFSPQNKHPYSPFFNEWLIHRAWSDPLESIDYDHLMIQKRKDARIYDQLDNLYSSNFIAGFKIVAEVWNSDNWLFITPDGEYHVVPGHSSGIYYYFKPYHVLQSRGESLEFMQIILDNDFVAEEKQYFRESTNHRYITRERKKKSEGPWLTTKYYYPQDFLSSENPSWLVELDTNNIVSNPLVKQKVNEYNLIESEVSTYKLRSYAGHYNNIPFPFEVYLVDDYVSGDPLWYPPPQIQTFFNNHYIDTKFTKYGEYGRLREKQSYSKQPISFVWGHHGLFPIAKIENIEYDDLVDLTSLYELVQNLNNYTTLNSPLKRKQLKHLNESIRDMAPEDVFISTYTYDPKIGVTSICESNGIITFYQYDMLGRLILVRDQDDNIVSKYDYHYREDEQTEKTDSR